MRKNYAVIAAGGLGTRLKDYKKNNSTKVLIDINGISMISLQIKQLLSWGLSNFVIITNPEYHEMIKNDVKKNFNSLDINFVIQLEPNGIADALSYASEKIPKNSLVTFVLGDNFFGSNPFVDLDLDNFSGAHLFVKDVSNPQEFGVIEVLDSKIINLHEKPQEYISSYAVVGLYIYEYECFDYIRLLKPSKRGELEITDLNKIFLNKKDIKFSTVQSWWVDAGTEERIDVLRKLI
jgi:glucose-1-phosphate thymidylyltransferase